MYPSILSTLQERLFMLICIDSSLAVQRTWMHQRGTDPVQDVMVECIQLHSLTSMMGMQASEENISSLLAMGSLGIQWDFHVFVHMRRPNEVTGWNRRSRGKNTLDPVCTQVPCIQAPIHCLVSVHGEPTSVLNSSSAAHPCTAAVRLGSHSAPRGKRLPSDFRECPRGRYQAYVCRTIWYILSSPKNFPDLGWPLTWEPHEEAKCSRTFVGRQNESMENTKNIS